MKKTSGTLTLADVVSRPITDWSLPAGERAEVRIHSNPLSIYPASEEGEPARTPESRKFYRPARFRTGGR